MTNKTYETAKRMGTRALTTGLVGLIGMGSFGCSNDKPKGFTHYGRFKEHPVMIGAQGTTRFMYIDYRDRNRGYMPTTLVAEDNDSKPGFETFNTSLGYDHDKGRDTSGAGTLLEMSNPMELERIYAYVNADRIVDEEESK